MASSRCAENVKLPSRSDVTQRTFTRGYSRRNQLAHGLWRPCGEVAHCTFRSSPSSHPTVGVHPRTQRARVQSKVILCVLPRSSLLVVGGFTRASRAALSTPKPSRCAPARGTDVTRRLRPVS